MTEPIIGSSIFQQAIGSSISGAILYLVMVPLIKALMKKVDERDAYIKTLVEQHLAHDHDIREKMIRSLGYVQSALEQVPHKTVAMITKNYPPDLIMKSTRKILKHQLKTSRKGVRT